MSPRGRPLAALFAAVLCLACRLERRPDGPGSEPAPDAPAASGNEADSAQDVIGAMALALAAGDPARVSEVSTGDAVLIDQDERVRWTRADSVGPLPAPLPVSERDLGWRLRDSSFMRLSPDAALLSLRYQASVSVDSIPRSAVESWVLVRTDGSWKVRYLHRSRGLGGSASRP